MVVTLRVATCLVLAGISVAIEYFCVAIEFGQGQEFLCRNRVFLCRDRVWPWAWILCCDKMFLCRDKVWSRPRVFMS